MPQANRFISGDESTPVEASRPVEDGRLRLVACYHRARANRGDGELFTELVNDRLGSFPATVAIRLGIHPSVLTLTGFVLGVIASIVVIAHADDAHGLWAPGLFGFVCWQLAYVLDCADGQVARATGKQSDFGGRVDVLVDFSVQSSIICAVVTVIARWSHRPIVLLAVFATTWFVNLIVFLLSRADGNVGHSFSSSRRAPIRMMKLLRDYGFVLFVINGWLAVAPRSVIMPVLAVTVVNSAFLVASIGREAWLSMRGA
jgi:phosphatidylglycerophosphate synthase